VKRSSASGCWMPHRRVARFATRRNNRPESQRAWGLMWYNAVYVREQRAYIQEHPIDISQEM